MKALVEGSGEEDKFGNTRSGGEAVKATENKPQRAQSFSGCDRSQGEEQKPHLRV